MRISENGFSAHIIVMIVAGFLLITQEMDSMAAFIFESVRYIR